MLRNDPARAGQRASRNEFFGLHSRFALFAVHTRFDRVQWLITDAEQRDELTDGPKIIGQIDDTDREAIVAHVARCMRLATWTLDHYRIMLEALPLSIDSDELAAARAR